MKKSILRMVCFFFILITVLCYINKVFAFKNGGGIYDFTKFYELEDNTVDVLVLGSSHAYQAVNTDTLWQEHGISSFVLAGSGQPMWNTYYYLKEALNTQIPKLIILEAYMTTKVTDYGDDFFIISNTYGMKWSKNKMEAIKVSAPQERWSELTFDYMQYHTRYTDLSRADFVKNQGNPLYENWKGYECNMAAVSFDTPNVSEVTKKEALSRKTETYYRKIIELAAENDIPLLIVVSPYAGIDEKDQAMYHTAADIAAEYHVDFVNYNLLYDEIGIDFSCDAADSHHLNYKGSQKYTHSLGGYIINHYDIPDRRGNDKYESWELDSQYLESMIKSGQLAEADNVSDIIQNIDNQEYLLFVSVDGNCYTFNDERLDDNAAFLFNILNIPHDNENGIWYINNQSGFLYVSGSESDNTTFRLDYHDVCLSRVFDETSQQYSNLVSIDGTEYKKVTNGINITVYNPLTQSVVDSFGFDMDDNYHVVR